MKLRTIKSNIYEIKEEGLISNIEFGEGRLIPAVIINSNDDSRVKEWINLHKGMIPGDITSSWGYNPSGFFGIRDLTLNLNVKKPINLEFQITFNIKEFHSVIHSVFRSRALYVGVGEKGDKVSKHSAGLVLVEIPQPEAVMEKKWNRLLREVLSKIAKKRGFNKRDIKKEVEKQIEHMDQLLEVRIESE